MSRYWRALKEAWRKARKERLQAQLGVWGDLANARDLESLQKDVTWLAKHLGFHKPQGMFGMLREYYGDEEKRFIPIKKEEPK